MQSVYYQGGSCHHPALLVYAFKYIAHSDLSVAFIWAFVDVFLIGGLVYLVALMYERYPHLFSPTSFKQVSKKYSLSKDELALDFKMLVLDKETVSATMAVTMYLLCPLTILSTLSQSTIIFTNLCIMASIFFAFKGKNLNSPCLTFKACRSLSMMALAAGTMLSFYPWMLVLPISLLLQQTRTQKASTTLSILRCIMTYSVWMVAFLGMTFLLLAGPAPKFNTQVESLQEFVSESIFQSDWFLKASCAFHQYLLSTFGMILSVTDLSPNIGLYWYFFVEMFDTFRIFFVAVTQLHLVALVAPVTIKFRSDPLFAVFLLTGMAAVLKSYPSMGETALFLGALFPMQRMIFKCMLNSLLSVLCSDLRYSFLTMNLYFFSTILLPFFHYIWIYAGTGNANFFYAITLLWSLAGVLTLTDCVRACLRRQWDLALHSSDLNDVLMPSLSAEELDIYRRVQFADK